MKRFLFLLFFFPLSHNVCAQPVFRDAMKGNRERLYRNIVKNTIINNLSTPLSDSTEENWQDAFWAIQVINYRSPWSDNKIHGAIDEIQKRSVLFQRSILELTYAVYPGIYYQQVRSLLSETTDAKIFAMCANYILKTGKPNDENLFLLGETKKKILADTGNVILQQLLYQINNEGTNLIIPSIQSLLQKDYFPGKVLMLSFQRKDRDLPGLVMVRDTNGIFIKDPVGNYFSVPQLARSVTDLPGYLTNGNTPQGIFRMDGFSVSTSNFIGPTSNIQLTMPFEYKASHYYDNASLNDTIWDIEMYKDLLPDNFKGYYPLYQSYFAGKAGRTEIIAHGSTIDPEYYKGREFYPLTPTQGCLCTKETWSDVNGKLLESDQQKLSDTIAKAGGPHGYAIVIDIDDRQVPVSIDDIIPFLELAKQK